jgi:zinc transporter 2
LGDLIQSIGVIIASIFIYFFPKLKIIDPLCTFIFSIIVLYTTVGIVKQCLNNLMECVPEDVNIEEIKIDIKSLPEVESLHDIHLWYLNPEKKIFTCHVKSSNPAVALQNIKLLMNIKYRIFHVTIQVEPKGIANPSNIQFNWENDIHD